MNMEKHIPNEKELTAWLKELPDDPKLGMKVPEEYFEKLPDQVLSKIKIEEKPNGKRILRYLPIAAIAAAVLLMLWLMPAKTSDSLEFDSDLYTAMTYLMENEYDLTTDQLALLADDVVKIDIESYINTDQPNELEEILEEITDDLEDNYSQLF